MKEAIFKHLAVGVVATFSILSSLGACSADNKKNEVVDEDDGAGGSGGDGGTGGEAGESGASGGTGGTGGGDGGSGGGNEAECQTSSDCDGDLICDPFLDECVECLYASDCADGEHCIRQSCDAIVECGNSLDCADDEVCDPLREICVECVNDTDCGDDAICETNLCVPAETCTNSLDCSGSLVCDTSRDRCVRCVSNADCPASGTRCVFNKCRLNCSSDTNCRGLGLLCDTTSYGVCMDCVSGNDCPTAYHCFQGSCRLDVCEPGNAYCSNNVLYQCEASGGGYAAVSCTSTQTCIETSEYEASCEDWACTPGATECDSTNENIIECSDDGLEILETVNCADQICYNGACEDLACAPSELFCLDNQSYYCDSTGQAYSLIENCPALEENCNPSTGECEPLFCEPEAAVCDGDIATTCNTAGDAYEEGGTDCTSSGQVCVGGACADCNNTVLFLSDADTYGNALWVTAMENAGLVVTQVDSGIATYDGTTPAAAADFGAIVLHTAYEYDGGLPTTGQQAIAAAQAAGTGLVIYELGGYAIENSYWPYLSSLSLLSFSSSASGTPTFTLTETGHPIWDGLPEYWTSTQSMYVTLGQLINGGTAIATCDTCNPTSYSGAAVAVRNDGGGRIVHVAHWGNYSAAYYDNNLLTLNANAAEWAAACN